VLIYRAGVKHVAGDIFEGEFCIFLALFLTFTGDLRLIFLFLLETFSKTICSMENDCLDYPSD
jgi:hypothetical protein